MQNDSTYKSYKVLAKSAELPAAMALVRQHLRNEDLRFDDDLVASYIRAAAATIERQYGLALLQQTVAQYHSAFPNTSDKPMRLRIAPLLSITSVVYVDSEGAAQTWAADNYTTGHYNGMPILVPKVGVSWPTAKTDAPNAVVITYEAGFGTSSEAVPADIRSAMLLIIAHLYEHRDDPPMSLPRASDILLQPYYQFSA